MASSAAATLVSAFPYESIDPSTEKYIFTMVEAKETPAGILLWYID